MHTADDRVGILEDIVAHTFKENLSMSETAENKILEIAQRIKRNRRSRSRRGRSRSPIKATPEPKGEAKKENKDLGEGRVELEKKELGNMEKGPEHRNEILDKFVDDVGDNITGGKNDASGGPTPSSRNGRPPRPTMSDDDDGDRDLPSASKPCRDKFSVRVDEATLADWNLLSARDLKELCRENGLCQSGNKAALRNRLIQMPEKPKRFTRLFSQALADRQAHSKRRKGMQVCTHAAASLESGTIVAAAHDGSAGPVAFVNPLGGDKPGADKQQEFGKDIATSEIGASIDLPRDPEGGPEEPEETMELEELERRPEDNIEILDKFLDGLDSLKLRWRDPTVGGVGRYVGNAGG